MHLPPRDPSTHNNKKRPLRFKFLPFIFLGVVFHTKLWWMDRWTNKQDRQTDGQTNQTDERQSGTILFDELMSIQDI